MTEDQQTNAIGDLPARIEVASRKLKKLAADIRKSFKGKWSVEDHQQLTASGDAIFAELRTIESAIAKVATDRYERMQRLWLELETRVREIGEKHGWCVVGSWPSYLVAYGIQIQFEEKAHTATLGSRKLVVFELSELESFIQEEVEDLIPRDFAPQRFLDLLYAAYQDARKNSDQVPIFELYQALVIRAQRPGYWRNATSARFSGLTIEQFRARLTVALKSGALKTRSNNEIRLFPPLDPRDGLFFFNPLDERLQFLGRVAFTDGASLRESNE